MKTREYMQNNNRLIEKTSDKHNFVYVVDRSKIKQDKNDQSHAEEYVE